MLIGAAVERGEIVVIVFSGEDAYIDRGPGEPFPGIPASELGKPCITGEPPYWLGSWESSDADRGGPVGLTF